MWCDTQVSMLRKESHNLVEFSYDLCAVECSGLLLFMAPNSFDPITPPFQPYIFFPLAFFIHESSSFSSLTLVQTSPIYNSYSHQSATPISYIDLAEWVACTLNLYTYICCPSLDHHPNQPFSLGQTSIKGTNNSWISMPQPSSRSLTLTHLWSQRKLLRRDRDVTHWRNT